MSQDLVTPGKKLLKPLLHPVTGNTLLPAGTVLTEAYIDRLTRQGLIDVLALCLEAPDAAAGGMGGVKDLDDFDIDIPDLPMDLLAGLMPAAAPAPAAVPAGAAPNRAPVPPGAAPPPGWVPTGHAAPAAPAAPVPGQMPPPPPPMPGMPGAAYGTPAPPAPPPGWVPTGYAPPGMPPAAPPPPPKFAEPAARMPGAVTGQAAPPAVATMRYYHNPSHMMPERGIMAAIQAVEQVESQLKSGQLPSYDGIRRVVDEVIERLSGNLQALANGAEVRIVNQPHDKSHPINVFTLSIVMGLALNYTQDDLRTLGVAALCHDIGKTAIPPEILNKVGPLSPHEIEMLRAHTLMGKRIMEKLPWATALMAKIVYEHHERNDGSGYPLRLQGHQIHEMSKIVAVAEVYDALISDTSYRARYTPEASYNSIRAGERTGLDAKVIKAFQKYIVPYPVNSFVMLDTQEVGQVLSINRSNVFKPVIKVGGETVDLVDQSKRSIVNSHFQAY